MTTAKRSWPKSVRTARRSSEARAPRPDGERGSLTGATGRAGLRARRVLVAALVFSLLLHLAVGGVWTGWAHHIASAVARYLPRPKPTPSEIVATSDTITITRQTVPRQSHRSPPRARPHRPAPRVLEQRPAPNALAQRPAPRTMALPTLAPLPSPRPTQAPPSPQRTPKPAPSIRAVAYAKIHRPRPAPSSEAHESRYTPHEAPRYAPREHVTVPHQESHGSAASRGAFSAEQLAALNARFSKTIADADRALTTVPAQRKPPSTMKHYQMVMAGSRGDLKSAQGQCRPTQTWRSGGSVWHYMDCDFLYTDGFAEHVLIPWPQHYPPYDDPTDHPGKSYVVEDPPPGFTLPHPFAFSRLVCIFYKSECDAVIARERANGDPAYAAP